MRYEATPLSPPGRERFIGQALEWLARDPTARVRHRALRVLVILVVGVALFTFFVGHPRRQQFLPFYAYVIGAIWYGDTWEGAGAVIGGAVAIAVLRLSQVPLVWIGQDIQIEALFLGSSLLLLYVMHSLRRARAQAQAARAVAEAAVMTRDSFLATISHDLKNPLQSITLRAQLLHLQHAQTSPDRSHVRTELAAIDKAADRMTRMIDDLLDLARLQEGEELALSPAPTDLVELTRQVIAEHAHLAQQHAVHIQEMAPRLVGQWDARRLERVLGNLLSNALKYSPNGTTVTITIATEGEEGKERARIEVQDDGRGIPARDLPRIFERFHRAGNVGQVRGTGLGLAGARQIVEQHGGSIEISSTENVGTQVVVRLPLVPSVGL